MKVNPKIIRSLFVFSALVLSWNGLLAQTSLLASERYPELKYNRVLGDVYYNDYMQIKGNAFLTDDWITGNILLKDGHEIKNINFKIDVFKHRLLVYQEYLKRITILDKHLIESFTILENGEKTRFILEDKYKTKANAEDGSFMQVLYEGELSFYKVYSRDVLPLRANEGILLDEFTDEIDYYLKYQGKYTHTRIAKSVLLNQFPKFKVEMKQYIRKNKLHVKKEGDFVIALAHLSQLLELVSP